MKKAIRLFLFVLVLVGTMVLGTSLVSAAEYKQITDKKTGYTTTITLPEKVEGVSAKKISPSTISIQWDTWNNYYIADGYEVCTVNSSGKLVHRGYYKSTVSSCKLKELKSNTTYKICVRGYVKYNGVKYFGKRSDIIKATTSPKKTTLKSVRYVSTGKMEVKWSSVSSATGYIVQYSTRNDFSSKYTCTEVVSKNTTLSKSISGLAGKTYYVRVASYKTVGGRRYASQWSDVKSVNIKAGASLKTMINSTKTDLSGRDIILMFTNNGVDIKKYSTTYDRLKAIYNWHAKHYKDFANCVECNSSFNSCVDALFGSKRQYDSFIWLAADNFQNNDGSIVQHKWSVLFIKGVKLIFDPRLQGYTGNYTGDMYFGISPTSAVGKHYKFDYWYASWRDQAYNSKAIIYSSKA